MGEKGDRMTSGASISIEILFEKLAAIKGISSRKMFGGFGIFCDQAMFGIVDPQGNIFLKADEKTQQDFEKYGSEKHSRMPYYGLPQEILDNNQELLKWVNASISISH